MAINTDLLIILPFLGQFIQDAETSDPLLGEVFFYKTNKITLKNIYQQTGDPFNPFEIAPNPIQLNAAGGFVNGSGNIFVPYLYPFDEDDQTVEELYYVEVRRTDTSLAWALDNFPQNFIGSGQSDELPTGNLFSNYGFDTQVNANIYELDSIGTSFAVTLSSGVQWIFTSSQTTANNTYSFVNVSDAGLIGNPKNELVIRSIDNVSGQTENLIRSGWAPYNAFQNKQIALSIFTRLESGNEADLVVSLVRQKNGVLETPIVVGTIPITSARTQRILAFTVPQLLDNNYSNNDLMFLDINLPLNENLEYGFTGRWIQLSESGSVSITEESPAAVAAKTLSNIADDQYKVPQYVMRGLPLTSLGEGTTVLLQTGGIFLAPTSTTDNFSEGMVAAGSVSLGGELIRDRVIKTTQTNRLIDFLRNHGMAQSRLSFTASSATNIITVGLGIGAPPHSPWVSNATPRITVTKPTEELIYKLRAIPLGNGLVRFFFVDNFNANTTFHNPAYSPGGGPVFAPAALPASPIINWLGFWDFEGPTSPLNVFTPSVHSVTQAIGTGSTPAIVDVHFTAPRPQLVLIRSAINKDEGPGVQPFVVESTRRYTSNYHGYNNLDRIFIESGSNDQGNSAGQANFLSYNDVTSNPVPQGAIPPRVIRFTVDGVASGAPTGTLSTLNVPIDSTDNAAQIAARVSHAVNTSFEYRIVINSEPINGDTVQISNANTDFNVIWWDTAQSRPSNPSASRAPIYVPFETTQTFTQIATESARAINYGVAGIPRSADLGLTFPAPVLPVGLQYYMKL